MEVSDLIAAVALLVSIAVAVAQYRLGKRMAGIETARRAEEIERQQSADVTAALEATLDSRGKPSRRFVLRNRGPAPAHDVIYEIAPVGEGMAPALACEPDLPLPMLDADQPFAIPALMMMGTAAALDVTLRWTDEQGQKEKHLRLSTVQ